MENRFTKRRIPENESERLKKLFGYHVPDHYELSGTFQHIAGMAAQIFNVPIGLVSFVNKDVVSVGASVGLDGILEIERDISLCSMAILQDEVTVFENAKDEPCLVTNPLVYGELGLRFYAAAPLKSPDGYNIGVISVADKKPRTFSKEEEQVLASLGAIVMDELEEKTRK